MIEAAPNRVIAVPAAQIFESMEVLIAPSERVSQIGAAAEHLAGY